MKSNYLACDLGAESGRLTLGVLNKGKLTLTELHRFPNVPVQTKKELHWDIPSLYQGLLEGLRRAAEREDPIQSISCDSWGLDYLLFDAEGSLITPAYHYRDPRCHDGVKTDRPRRRAPGALALRGAGRVPHRTAHPELGGVPGGDVR
jgi:rhamnulokinase